MKDRYIIYLNYTIVNTKHFRRTLKYEINWNRLSINKGSRKKGRTVLTNQRSRVEFSMRPQIGLFVRDELKTRQFDNLASCSYIKVKTDIINIIQILTYIWCKSSYNSTRWQILQGSNDTYGIDTIPSQTIYY